MIQTVACPVCSEWNLSIDNFCQNCGAALRDASTSNGATSPGSTDTMEMEPGVPTRLFADAGWETESRDSAPRHVIAFKTDVGRVHHTNQDAGGVWTWAQQDGTPLSLLVVADGVSAGRHSEEASRLAVEMLHERIANIAEAGRTSIDVLASALVDSTKQANYEIAKRPHHSLSSADATVLVAACCLGPDGAGVWCGDSRVYHIRDGKARRLTSDHSWAEQVVEHGLMTAEDAARDPRAHMITRWLGPPHQDDPGLETFRFSLEPGDILLCCSDGLYGYFTPPAARSEDEMATALDGYQGSLQGGIEELVQTANERGGRDNISVAALAFSPGRDEETLHIKAVERGPGDETLHIRFPITELLPEG